MASVCDGLGAGAKCSVSLQGIISLEKTWGTHRWECRIFTFILAIVEVNTFLALRYFVWSDDEQMEFIPFRRKLAKALIHNEYAREEEGSIRQSKRAKSSHELMTAPPKAKKIVGGKWDLSAKKRYQQYKCQGDNCEKRIHTYYQCHPGMWLCISCHQQHIICVITKE